jgi:uncharacterized protein YukE
MTSNTRIRSGALFVKFASIGLTALFTSVVFLKYSNIAGAYTAIALGGAIFLINLFSVLGYTLEVLKNPSILAESDSPDLAYYLGFSLTVGALSATFITDTLISQFASLSVNPKDVASVQSDLVKGSLVQFGVGLTATLIGLCSKIYLASKQSVESTEPEELYRKFRNEIFSFQRGMEEVTTSYSQTVSNSTQQLENAITEACTAFENLSQTAKQSSAVIASNINQETIGRPVTEFLDSIRSFKDVSTNLSESGKQSAETFVRINNALEALSTSLRNTDSVIASLNENTAQLSDSTKSLLESNTAVKGEQQNLSGGIHTFTGTLKSANTSAESFSSNISGSNQGLSSLNNSILGISSKLSSFDNLLKNTIGNFKLNADSVKSFSSDIDNFHSGIKKIIAELNTLESKLNKINRN